MALSSNLERTSGFQPEGEGSNPSRAICKLYLGDCLEIMKQLPDKAFDLILTDPPYQIRVKSKIELHGRKAFYHNYEEFIKLNSVDIKELYKKIYPEFDRLLKETGSVLMFVRNEYITYAVEEGQKNNLDLKCVIYWHKTNPPPQVRKKNYLSAVETIIWQARSGKSKFTFNFKLQKEMLNFISMPICGGKERTIHPTQKPLKLIEHLLEIHSNPGDFVLDPFLGSGTTAVACIKLKRNIIGIEIEPKYFEIAQKRIKEVQKTLL